MEETGGTFRQMTTPPPTPSPSSRLEEMIAEAKEKTSLMAGIETEHYLALLEDIRRLRDIINLTNERAWIDPYTRVQISQTLAQSDEAISKL